MLFYMQSEKKYHGGELSNEFLLIYIIVMILAYLGYIAISRTPNKKLEKNIHSSDTRIIPSYVRKEVWERDGGKCKKCGSRHHLEFDHIVPVSKGGGNSAKNIELLCRQCNRSKHAKIE